MNKYTTVLKSSVIGLFALGVTAAHALPDQSEGFDENDVLYHVQTTEANSEVDSDFDIDWNDVGG